MVGLLSMLQPSDVVQGPLWSSYTAQHCPHFQSAPVPSRCPQCQQRMAQFRESSCEVGGESQGLGCAKAIGVRVVSLTFGEEQQHLNTHMIWVRSPELRLSL